MRKLFIKDNHSSSLLLLSSEEFSISTSPSTSGVSSSSCSYSLLELMSTSISSTGAFFFKPNPTLSSFCIGNIKSVGFSMRKPEFRRAILYSRVPYSPTSSSTSPPAAYLTRDNISLITGWCGFNSRVFLASM